MMGSGLSDQGPEPLFTLGPVGTILERNASARALGEVAVFSALFADPESIERLVALEFVGAGERELQLRDGRCVLLVASRLPGNPSQYSVGMRDVTAYRALREELQQARRTAAIGGLAIGIAKEINNPLAVILGRLELMAALGYGDPQVTARHLGVVADHAQRIAEFVDNLNVLTRAGAGQREEMDLLAVLDEAQDSCRRRLGFVQVQRMLDPPELTIWANPEQLGQALRVLFCACGDAMRGRGRLEVRARPEGSQCAIEFLGSALTSVSSHLADLESASDGSASLSTPISLTLAATILADQGGLLEPARGRRQPGFRLELPLGRVGASPRRSDRENSSTRARHVLVIEDEAPMAELIVEMLKTAGVRGVIASTAEEGLEALTGASFDVVICDLALPGMSGLSFRETVANRWPDQLERVVLMSGFPEPPFLGAVFLHKPFTRAELLRVLGEASGPSEGV